jgi:serine-type D-Ala-D-Ala carboxypeptidase
MKTRLSKVLFILATIGLFFSTGSAFSQTISEQVEKEIIAGNILGAVVLAGTPDGILYHEAFGQMDTCVPMRKDAIFDVSSVTKPSSLGTSLAILLDQGKFGLSDRLKDHLPQLDARGDDIITIRHAVTHTSGLDNTKHLQRDHSGEALVEQIMKRDISREPGTKYEYSCLATIRLSEMVAHISGMEFGRFCEENIFIPLGMKDTQFGPLRDTVKLCRIASSTASHGDIQDPNAKKIGRPVGNAGMFTTAVDLSKLAVMWLQKGEYNGQRFFSEDTYEIMTSPQTHISNVGVIWNLLGDNTSPINLSRRTFFHTGYNGHVIYIDPVNNCYIIINSVWKHPAVTGSREDGRRARFRIAETVAREVLGLE